jgi:hypothetical protein
MRPLKAMAVAAALLALVGWSSAAVMAQSDSPKPEVGCEPSADDRWTVADLSAFEAAFESGDYDQVRALFTDDGIITTAWNTIGLYYGETAQLGTWEVDGAEWMRFVGLHAGEDMTVVGTPIQIGDNTVAFGWEWSSGVSGTALLHLRDGKIVVAILNPSQAPIPFYGDVPAE